MDFVSAGESHGHLMSGMINGFPAGVFIDNDLIENELLRRRLGFGRSERMVLEKDSFSVEAGVINRITTAAPIFFTVENRGGQQFFDRRIIEKIFPRPGHVDLPSAMKYDYPSVSIGAERSSARETVVQVVAGSFAKMLLNSFDVSIFSEVISIAGNSYPLEDAEELKNQAKISGTLGGHLKISVKNVVPGIGSNLQWFDRLDSYLAAKIMSIPSVKGLYLGNPNQHNMFGKDVIGIINTDFTPEYSETGGIDGGISNGSDIIINIYLKPIPTQPFDVNTVNYLNGQKGTPEPVRSDICAVESAAVVAESAVAFVLADMYAKKFGSDTLTDMKSSFHMYLKRIKWRKSN